MGFNRSFAGKNACKFGKGCYFARDASYSADPKYCVPDEEDVARILVCRVVRTNALALALARALIALAFSFPLAVSPVFVLTSEPTHACFS